MKKATLIALLFSALALADVSFYYTVKSVPSQLPGADTQSGGALVLVKMPVKDADVCVSFTAPDGDHHACASASGDTPYAYDSAYIDFGFDGAEVTVTSISVTSNGETKTVDYPAPAFEY